MRKRLILLGAIVVAASLLIALGGLRRDRDPSFTTDFGLDNSMYFVPDGGNRYFSLRPGHFVRLEGENGEGQFEEVEITVLNQVRAIYFEVDGTPKVAFARVIEERERLDGRISQISRNYYARCPITDNIYYFGEDVDHYNRRGRIIGHDGAWLAGEDGALPGLAMPATFLEGSRYHMENAPGISMDRAEHIGSGLTINTPAGRFRNCIEVLETSPLEPEEETLKIYAPGVGLIGDEALRVVEYTD